MATHATISCLCPACGACNDRCTNASGKDKPTSGDLTVCVYCGTVSVFTGPRLTLRKITDAEFEALDPEERRLLRRAQEVVKELDLKPPSSTIN